MHVKFVRTTNVRHFLAANERLKDRGAREASWLFAAGDPGLGKTRMLQWYSATHDAPYLTAKAIWTTNWMLREIAGEYGLDTAGSKQELFGQIARKMADSQKPLIVDEIGKSLSDGKLIETLRDLADLAECPVILGGEEKALRAIKSRFTAVASRISEVVKFEAAPLEDVELICTETCQVEIGEGVAEEIERQSSGYYREIKNAVAAVERLARLQDVDRIEFAHVEGKRLCQDRRDVRLRSSV